MCRGQTRRRTSVSWVLPQRRFPNTLKTDGQHGDRDWTWHLRVVGKGAKKKGRGLGRAVARDP